MPKELIILADGTGDSIQTHTPGSLNNIQLLKLILGAELNKKSTNSNPQQGWEIDEYIIAEKTRTVMYLRGLGSPTLNAQGKVESWSWKPTSFFKDAEFVYAKFKDTEAEIVASGIIDKVAQIYKFLVQNYEPGDEVYFFGFSRGAYTGRLVESLLRRVDLLDRKKYRTEDELQQAIEQAFNLYDRHEHPDAAGSLAKQFRQVNCLSTTGLIKFFGAWDCVPGLLAEKIPEDNELSTVVQEAYHAIAINEYRPPFMVQVWHAAKGVKSKQEWFSGSHVTLGAEQRNKLANIPFHSLLNEARNSGLNIDQKSLDVPELEKDPLALQIDTSKEKLPGTNVTWNELFFRARRKVAQTSPDEFISKEALIRYGKEVEVSDGISTQKIIYKPSNLRRAIVSFQNGAHSFIDPNIFNDTYDAQNYSDDEDTTNLLIPKVEAKPDDNNSISWSDFRFGFCMGR